MNFKVTFQAISQPKVIFLNLRSNQNCISEMAFINENYLKLQAGYLFPEIGRRVNEFIKANPGKKVIRMGIGDVTQPLVPSVVKAFHEGVEEMANAKTFKGYGPEQGYGFLREAIAVNAFKMRHRQYPGNFWARQ